MLSTCLPACLPASLSLLSPAPRAAPPPQTTAGAGAAPFLQLAVLDVPPSLHNWGFGHVAAPCARFFALSTEGGGGARVWQFDCNGETVARAPPAPFAGGKVRLPAEVTALDWTTRTDAPAALLGCADGSLCMHICGGAAVPSPWRCVSRAGPASCAVSAVRWAPCELYAVVCLENGEVLFVDAALQHMPVLGARSRSVLSRRPGAPPFSTRPLRVVPGLLRMPLGARPAPPRAGAAGARQGDSAGG